MRLLSPVTMPLMLFMCGFSLDSLAGECKDWRTRNPAWIFCDDFESSAALVGPGRYFEVDNNKGDFAAIVGVGRGDSRGMRVIWQPGEVEAGNLKLGFGKNPSSYMNRGVFPDETFREIHYRVFVRMEKGWQGAPYKLSRATVISGSDWSQAMIAHLWTGNQENLMLDPVRCVDGNNNVKCKGYNNFANMEWIGQAKGASRIFSPDSGGKWMCIESYVRLNSPGKSDGVTAFWVNGKLEAKREGVDFVRGYTSYGLNAIFLENHWNSGSPKRQERYFDHFVVSRQPIGCNDSPDVVSLSPAQATRGGALSGSIGWGGRVPEGSLGFDATGRMQFPPLAPNAASHGARKSLSTPIFSR